MRSTLAPRLALALLALSLGLGTLALVLAALVSPASLPSAREPALSLVAIMSVLLLAYGTVGAVIVVHRPENPIGWLLLWIALSLGVVGAAYGYADYGLYGPGLPGAEIAGWIAEWLFIVPLFVGPCLLFLLFPDGRPPTPRWRPVLWLFAALALVSTAAIALAPGTLDPYPTVENPVSVGRAAGEVFRVIDDPGGTVVAPTVLLVALAALLVRFRRARGDERLQLKWLVFAAVLMAIAFTGSYTIGDLVSESASDAAYLAGVAGFAFVPVAAGIAIVRYRLYEIDRIINRAVVYGLVTAGLAGLYFGLVLALQQVFSSFAGGSDLAIAGSTLAVAALFRPARRRIQALVDRRFYRRRSDAQQTLEGFSARLREEIDLAALDEELRAAVSEAMQPAHVSLWIRTAAVTFPGRSGGTRELR